jgi:hypothetical protein
VSRLLKVQAGLRQECLNAHWFLSMDDAKATRSGLHGF